MRHYKNRLERIELPAAMTSAIQRRIEVFVTNWYLGNYDVRWLAFHGYLQGVEDTLQLLEERPNFLKKETVLDYEI